MKSIFKTLTVFLFCLIFFVVGNISSDYISVKDIIHNTDSEHLLEETEATEKDNPVGETAAEEPGYVQTLKYIDLEKQQQYSFSYQQLNETERYIYLEILHAIYHYESDTIIQNTNKDIVGKVFQCILNDHPEIFYVEGYTFTEKKTANNVTNIAFSAIYNMDEEEAQEQLKIIDEKANQCIAALPADADDYGKVKYVYEYLIKHTEYDVSAENNQNICSVFLSGKSVCQGYAKATQYLLQKCGIVSTLVLGEIIGGNSHAWNLVKVDGEYYYVDTTWGDASYQIDLQDENTEVPTLDINYDYLCVTTEQLSKTHSINNVVGLPQCTCLDANYYVREGTYFKEYNEEQIRKAFQKGKSVVTLKASDFGTYVQLKNALIVKQQVFDYIDSSIADSVTYLDNENQYSITFWLEEGKKSR